MVIMMANRLLVFVTKKLQKFLTKHVAERRQPDFVIGGNDDPYLKRWYIIPRNPVFNIYLHHFLRSDDDRALHTHPWINLSLVLDGAYIEHTKDGEQRLIEGDFKLRLSGNIAHRIELRQGSCWTLFVTGPRYQEWGFLCPQGFVHWKNFTDPADKGGIGLGCDQ